MFDCLGIQIKAQNANNKKLFIFSEIDEWFDRLLNDNDWLTTTNQRFELKFDLQYSITNSHKSYDFNKQTHQLRASVTQTVNKQFTMKYRWVFERRFRCTAVHTVQTDFTTHGSH